MQHTQNSGTSFDLPDDLNELVEIRAAFDRQITSKREEQVSDSPPAQIFTFPAP